MRQCNCGGELFDIKFNYLGWGLLILLPALFGAIFTFSGKQRIDDLLFGLLFFGGIPLFFCLLNWMRYSYGHIGTSVVECGLCGKFFSAAYSGGYRVKKKWFFGTIPVRKS